MPKTLQRVLTLLGFGYLYDQPATQKPMPSYCMFCNDVSEDDLMAHGGCGCCGNNGAYD